MADLHITLIVQWKETRLAEEPPQQQALERQHSPEHHLPRSLVQWEAATQTLTQNRAARTHTAVRLR